MQKINLGIKEFFFDAAIEFVEKMRKVRPELRLLTFACSKKKLGTVHNTRVEMLGKTFLLNKYVLFVKSKYKYAPFDDKHGTSSLQNPHIANIFQIHFVY